MLAKIQNWGNSQGIRIPKSILSLVDFDENEEVEILALDGKIVIEHSKRHKTLKERLKNYDGDTNVLNGIPALQPDARYYNAIHSSTRRHHLFGF